MIHQDTYKTPEGFDLYRPLVFPDVTDLADLLTAERPWDFATMNHKNGYAQPETPADIRRPGWEKVVGRFMSVRHLPGPHWQVSPTDRLLDVIYDEHELHFAFFDRVGFEAIYHERTDRVLLTANASGLIAQRYLAYLHPDTMPTQES